ARRNAEHHRVADRITFLQSDLLSSVVRRPSSVNLLCANLPYIASDELRDLPVAWHEPALALDGGPDGLSLIRRLLADAPRVMAPHGGLLLEIGATQGKRAIALARKEFPETQVTLHQDLAGLDRVVAIRL
ncbi:MAG: N5-glutamine methyltransferase family protein, partial [Anaerolineales bacterium]